MGVKEAVLGLPPFTLIAGEKYPDMYQIKREAAPFCEDDVSLDSLAKMAEVAWTDKLVAFDGLKSIVRRFRERED